MTDFTDTITINGVTYGPPIPHDPTPVKLSDGTMVQPVCPWPDVPLWIKCADGTSDSPYCSKELFWYNCGEATITAYRLPADHHAYGDRRSSRGEPDRCYSMDDVDMVDRDTAIVDADCMELFGIWRIYKKGEAK